MARKKPKSLTTRIKAAAAKEQSEAEAENADAVRVLKEENRRLKRQLSQRRGNEDLILEAYREAYSEPLDIKIPKPPKQSKRGRHETAVLHVSDVHLGNDSANCKLRLQQLAAKTIEITEVRRTFATIDTLHLYLGGDMVDGEAIYAGHAHDIDIPLLEQAARSGPEVFAGMAYTLLQSFNRVDIVAVPGNHGRPASSRKTNPFHHRTNWDNVCYETLRLRLQLDLERAKRSADVTFSLPGDRADAWYAMDDVYGYRNMVIHGDQVRGGFAGFPWYGLGKKVGGWKSSLGHFDYLYLGHFHTFCRVDLNNTTALANGAIEPTSPYALEQLASASPPRQRLAFYNEKHGLVSDNAIYLG